LKAVQAKFKKKIQFMLDTNTD